jgi:16S rRNA (adenine1518-N6/adenine1519-N6)-dimethyltransferase
MKGDGMRWMDVHPRNLLGKLGLRPRKALGQNFLVRPDALDRVVAAAELAPRDVVLEIGTGIGRLTARLAQNAAHVVTVEMDTSLHNIAATHLAEFRTVTLLCCDFMAGKHRISPEVTERVKEAVWAGGAPLRVVSNLPYSISSPAIVSMLEWEVMVRDMHLMLQREVARRVAASPGTSDYGPLTVYVGYWAESRKLYDLPPRAFWPKPEVASSLIRVVRRPDRVAARDYDAFSAVVRRMFTSRRKRLARVLRNGWGKQVAAMVIGKLGLDPDARPETLGVADFEAIADLTGAPPRN